MFTLQRLPLRMLPLGIQQPCCELPKSQEESRCGALCTAPQDPRLRAIQPGVGYVGEEVFIWSTRPRLCHLSYPQQLFEFSQLRPQTQRHKSSYLCCSLSSWRTESMNLIKQLLLNPTKFGLICWGKGEGEDMWAKAKYLFAKKLVWVGLWS